jgi:hypothetical protein
VEVDIVNEDADGIKDCLITVDIMLACSSGETILKQKTLTSAKPTMNRAKAKLGNEPSADEKL